MELVYDNHHLIERSRTDLLNESGEIVLWGIYDFSFKYRTRIFNVLGEEVAYVEKDISADDDIVGIYEPAGKKIDALVRREGKPVLEAEGLPFEGDLSRGEIKGFLHIDEGRLFIEKEDDLLKAAALLFSLVEIDR